MNICREMLTTERGTQISYILQYSLLSAVSLVMERIQQYEANKEHNMDWDERMFRFEYEDDLRLYNIKIFD